MTHPPEPTFQQRSANWLSSVTARSSDGLVSLKQHSSRWMPSARSDSTSTPASVDVASDSRTDQVSLQQRSAKWLSSVTARSSDGLASLKQHSSRRMPSASSDSTVMPDSTVSSSEHSERSLDANRFIIPVVGGIVGAVVFPMIAVPVLGLFGFGSAGVAAGSFAAGVQSSTTAAGSWFALAQSAGAVGSVSGTAAAGAGTVIGGAVGATSECVYRLASTKKMDRQKEVGSQRHEHNEKNNS